MLLNQQFFRFLTVGVLNTIFGYSLFTVLIMSGLHYTLACLICSLTGIIFNFKTTGKIVFNNNDNTLLLNFFLVYGLIYFVGIGIMKLNSYFIYNIYLNGAIAIPLTAVMSFFLNKYFVFRKITHETN